MKIFPARFMSPGCFINLVLMSAFFFTTQAISQPLHAADEQNTVEIAKKPRLLDPLSPSERSLAERLAQNANRSMRARMMSESKPRPKGLEGLENMQTLYSQHHNEDKNSDPLSRKADVFLYDYSNNESIRVVVDLKDNTVQDRVVTKGAVNQPFFTQREINAALQLIFDHPDMGSRLRNAYRNVSGQELINVNQLQAEGGIYFTDPRTPLGRITASCKEDRCMQLFIPINDSSFIDTSNVIVNLSTGEVMWTDQGISEHTH